MFLKSAKTFDIFTLLHPILVVLDAPLPYSTRLFATVLQLQPAVANFVPNAALDQLRFVCYSDPPEGLPVKAFVAMRSNSPSFA